MKLFFAKQKYSNFDRLPYIFYKIYMNAEFCLILNFRMKNTSVDVVTITDNESATGIELHTPSRPKMGGKNIRHGIRKST